MFLVKLSYLQHNIKRYNWQWQATENVNKIANGAPCNDAVHTLYHNLSYFKSCTVAQYTHTCNVICAHKKSTVFTYADFRGGGMNHSIMFFSLVMNFTQTSTTNVHRTHTKSFAPFNKAWLSLQHLVTAVTSVQMHQTGISYTTYNRYQSRNTESIQRNSFTPLNKVTGITRTIFTKLVRSRQLLNINPESDQIKIWKQFHFWHQVTQTDRRALSVST